MHCSEFHEWLIHLNNNNHTVSVILSLFDAPGGGVFLSSHNKIHDTHGGFYVPTV
jgi:hypothetical protein